MHLNFSKYVPISWHQSLCIFIKTLYGKEVLQWKCGTQFSYTERPKVFLLDSKSMFDLFSVYLRQNSALRLHTTLANILAHEDLFEGTNSVLVLFWHFYPLKCNFPRDLSIQQATATSAFPYFPRNWQVVLFLFSPFSFSLSGFKSRRAPFPSSFLALNVQSILQHMFNALSSEL